MTYFLIFSALLIVSYVIFTLYLNNSWNTIPEIDLAKGYNPAVTVLIPIRNEVKHIGSLLDALRDQSYSNLEVIVIDDGSNDGSSELVRTYQSATPYDLKLIVLSDGHHPSPKKRALAEGIAKASGEIIITTDGDCMVGHHWVEVMVSAFNNREVLLALGPVVYDKVKGLLGYFQMVEFASLIGLSGSSINAGYPTFANGANLAFKKKAFYEVNGYEGNQEIPSGDDEFLLLKIFKKGRNKIKFIKNQQAIVSTFAKPTLKEFYNQRKRWASKWKIRDDQGIKLFVVWVFLVNLLTVFALLVGFFTSETWFWRYFLLLKGIADGVFLFNTLRFLKRKKLVLSILIFEIFHPIYLFIFGVLTNFGDYTWKGRKFK